jgi:hypothetical protein
LSSFPYSCIVVPAMAISAEADSIHCRKRVEDKLIRPHSSKSRSSFAVSENALSSLRYRETILIQHVHGCPHDQYLFIFFLTWDGKEADTVVAARWPRTSCKSFWMPSSVPLLGPSCNT